METKTGWLAKQSDWLMVWNRRLFSVRGRTISYKENENSQDKKCARLEGLEPGTGTPMVFRVWVNNGDVWTLRTDSQELFDEWVDMFKRILLCDSTSVSQSSTALEPEEPAAQSVPAIRGVVQKRSFWVHSWRDRYVSVEGNELQYAEKEGDPVKRRYLIVSSDRCEEPCEISIRCSDGDYFRIRLSDELRTSVWQRTIRAGLRGALALRWQEVPLSCEGKEKSFVSTHFHSMFSIGPKAVIHGGKSETTSEAPGSTVFSGEIVSVQLLGDFKCELLSVHPVVEGPGAKVRPLPRAAAASVIVDGKFILHGGSNLNNVLGDLWMIELSKANELAWTRLVDTNEAGPLPPLTGHTMSALSSSDVLVVGGCGKDLKPSTTAALFNPSKNSVSSVSPLSTPRAYHSAITLESGDVLVIGGKTSSGLALETVELFSCQQGDWVNSRLTHRLPAMVAPAVCLHGPEVFVFGGEDNVLPQLYSLVQVGDSIVVKHIEVLGQTPEIHSGLSAYVYDEHLYIFGGGVKDKKSGSGVHRMLLDEKEDLI